MKLLTSAALVFFMAASSLVFGGSGPSAGGTGAAAPTPQLMQQNMYGRPDIAGDGINNATQVDDPADIGRSGTVSPDAPQPLPVEGGAGVQQAK